MTRSFSYEIDYDARIAAAEAKLAEVEKALEKGWYFEKLWPDLPAADEEVTYRDAVEEIPAFAESLSLTAADVEALSFYEKHYPTQGGVLSSYQRKWLTDEQVAQWVTGKNIYERLARCFIGSLKTTKARRKKLKADISRWKRNKKKFAKEEK